MIVSNSKKCTKKWKDEVLNNYNYKCTKCGSSYDVVAHHILSRNDRPDLINETENGIALCRKCHILEHQKQGEFKYQYVNIDFLIKNINDIFLTSYSEEELTVIKNRLYKKILDEKFN